MGGNENQTFFVKRDENQAANNLFGKRDENQTIFLENEMR